MNQLGFEEIWMKVEDGFCLMFSKSLEAALMRLPAEPHSSALNQLRAEGEFKQ
jgi:hypothetical protein